MSRPWLSVIMPTYNGAAYLEAALHSVEEQADDGVELIAIDDGSTDETLPILERYSGRLNLRSVSRGRVGNWVANTNHALRLASADHACFLHQDDLWLPGRIRALRPLLNRRGDAVMVLHPAQYVDARGQFLGPWRCPLSAGLHPSERMVERLLVQNFIAIPSPIFSRQAALGLGGLDEGLWYAADWDFWLKLASAGPALYHPKPLASFRVHGASQTMNCKTKAAEMRRQLDAVLNRHLPPWQEARPGRGEIGAVARLSAEMNQALAAGAGGSGQCLWGLAHRFLALGLSGCHRYLRDSRIVERVQARLRAAARSLAARHRPAIPVAAQAG
jgi:glycosyltransferase involved in cell wall biosynthesis